VNNSLVHWWVEKYYYAWIFYYFFKECLSRVSQSHQKSIIDRKILLHIFEYFEVSFLGQPITSKSTIIYKPLAKRFTLFHTHCCTAKIIDLTKISTFFCQELDILTFWYIWCNIQRLFWVIYKSCLTFYLWHDNIKFSANLIWKLITLKISTSLSDLFHFDKAQTKTKNVYIDL